MNQSHKPKTMVPSRGASISTVQFNETNAPQLSAPPMLMGVLVTLSVFSIVATILVATFSIFDSQQISDEYAWLREARLVICGFILPLFVFNAVVANRPSTRPLALLWLGLATLVEIYLALANMHFSVSQLLNLCLLATLTACMAYWLYGNTLPGQYFRLIVTGGDSAAYQQQLAGGRLARALEALERWVEKHQNLWSLLTVIATVLSLIAYFVWLSRDY